jgi:hypothetical protein
LNIFGLVVMASMAVTIGNFWRSENGVNTPSLKESALPDFDSPQLLALTHGAD